MILCKSQKSNINDYFKLLTINTMTLQNPTIDIVLIIKQLVEEFYKMDWDFNDFLTEDDVRCLLFSKLKTDLINYSTVSIHAEVRWYGTNSENNKILKYRSDIVLIDKTDLELNNNILPLPTKGYGFNKYYAIIEIKLRRPNDNHSDKSYNKIIQNDINKLKEIKNRTKRYSAINNRKYLMLAFDKKRNKKLFLDIDLNDSIVWNDWL